MEKPSQPHMKLCNYYFPLEVIQHFEQCNLDREQRIEMRHISRVTFAEPSFRKRDRISRLHIEILNSLVPKLYLKSLLTALMKLTS